MSRPRTLLAWALLAATVLAVTAGRINGAVALAERSGWPVFRAAERGLIFADVPAYYRHASNAAQGLVPYRDDPIEYPLRWAGDAFPRRSRESTGSKSRSPRNGWCPRTIEWLT